MDNACVLSYADDLLVSTCDLSDCIRASVMVLQQLAEDGFKVSLSKLQFAKDTVNHLGFVLRQGERLLSADRVALIRNNPASNTRRQMLTFLALVTYCRQ